MKLLVSCLEPSANLHFEQVLAHLKKVEICGIFDPKFGSPLYTSDEFSAMGFAEVLPLVLKAKRALAQMVELARSCDTVLLIDSPAFNIPLAKAIKKANLSCRVVYYVLPQIWAWKKGRAKIVEENCDELASIWPFEKDFWKDAIYVGHPLIDEIATRKVSYQKNGVVSFLAGSRKAEITRLMPVFRSLAPKIEAKKLLVVPAHLTGRIKEIYGDVSDFEVVCGTHEALTKSDFAFICSGTATLEAALIGTPFVLCYKARTFDVWLARKLIKSIKHIGLANIIFDFMGKEPLNVELIQNQVTPNALLAAYENYDAKKFELAAEELRRYLGHGSALNVAQLLGLAKNIL